MKTCPTCQRTYTDESLNFCLVDGSALGPSPDPNKTLQFPEARTTDPPIDRPAPQSTILAVQPSNPYANNPNPRPEVKRGGSHWVLIALGFAFVCLIGVAVVGAFIWTRSDTTAKNKDNSNVPKSTPTPLSSPRASPTASVEVDGWEKHEQTSINEGERITFYPGTTIEQCQTDCAENQKCIAYTYIKKGAYSPDDPPMCYLMSAIRTLNPSDCCFTGIRR
jgi:hypothetical protein